MNIPERGGLLLRTLDKMKRSQQKKKELLEYIEAHAPGLLGDKGKARRIRECANYLRFVDYVDGRTRLHTANFCKYDKFCLACATRRSIKKIQQFTAMIEDNKRESKYWYHITLTIRHHKGHTLEYLLNKLIGCRKKMAQRVRNSRREEQKDQSFFSLFDGMVASIEVTYSEKSGWHPHMHMLVCSSSPVDVERSAFLGTTANRELQKEWYRITTDSYCVAMRPVKVDKGYFERQGLAEVFKYAIKFSTLSVPRLVDLMKLQQRRKYKFYATYGIFRGRSAMKSPEKWLCSVADCVSGSTALQYDAIAGNYKKRS